MSGLGESTTDADTAPSSPYIPTWGPGSGMDQRVTRDTKGKITGVDAPENVLKTFRQNLPARVATSLTFNTQSKFSTPGEKALAAVEYAMPGGFLLKGIRTLALMGSGMEGTPADTNEGGDNEPPPVPQPLKKPARPLVGTATGIGQAGAGTAKTTAQNTGGTRLSASTISLARSRDRRLQGRPLISGTMLGIQDEELQRTLG